MNSNESFIFKKYERKSKKLEESLKSNLPFLECREVDALLTRQLSGIWWSKLQLRGLSYFHFVFFWIKPHHRNLGNLELDNSFSFKLFSLILHHLWWMRNSVSKGSSTAIKTSYNTTKATKSEFQVGLPLVRTKADPGSASKSKGNLTLLYGRIHSIILMSSFS